MAASLKTMRETLNRLRSDYERKQRERVSDNSDIISWHPGLSHPGLFAQYVCIRDEAGQWVPFDLWLDQLDALQAAEDSRLCIWLKARQLGMTWLALLIALWMMITKPGITVLLFSRRDKEAKELLDRLRGMNARLPKWCRLGDGVKSNTEEWQTSNGSRAISFPTTGGDSYNAALVIVDEADIIPDLGKLLRSVKPTIDAGGRMILLSRVDKTKPESEFKLIYKAAKKGENDYKAVFLPWNARPDRTPEWYEAQKRDVWARTGSLDDLYEQYPATDYEALIPRQLDKRIPWHWLEKCIQELNGVKHSEIPGCIVYHPPEKGEKYVIGLDPAEGNPTSDDSAGCVFDSRGRQCAIIQGKIEPDILSALAIKLSSWYNNADILCERNNHGHTSILSIRQANDFRGRLLRGHDGKHGWISTAPSKVKLYDAAAEMIREMQVTLHHASTIEQLASIEGGTLRAPEGQFDDLADAAALGLVGMGLMGRSVGRISIV